MSDYPRIGEPQRKPDGTWTVQVERGPGDIKDVAYPDKAGAERGVKALQMASELLAPAPAPPVPAAPKQQIADIVGPVRGMRGKYILRWTEDGKQTSKTATRKELVELRHQLEGTAAVDVPLLQRRAKFASLDWFKRSMQDALEANRDAVNGRDWDAIKVTRLRISALRESWQMLSVLQGYEELEYSHDAVLGYLETHGHLVEVEGATELQPASPQLAAALGGTAGPWETVGRPGVAVPDRERGSRGGSN